MSGKIKTHILISGGKTWLLLQQSFYVILTSVGRDPSPNALKEAQSILNTVITNGKMQVEYLISYLAFCKLSENIISYDTGN